MDLQLRIEKLEGKKKKAKEPSGVSAVRDAFLKSYKLAHKDEYPGWGLPENVQVARWLKSIPIEKALVYAKIYPFWQTNAVVVRAGHPLYMLIRNVVELDAHLKRYPEHVRKIVESRALTNVATKDLQKEAEVKAYGSQIESRSNPAIGNGGIEQIQNEDRKSLPGPCDGSTG